MHSITFSTLSCIALVATGALVEYVGTPAAMEREGLPARAPDTLLDPSIAR